MSLLITLVKDQVRAMNSRVVYAGKCDDEQGNVFKSICRGEYQLIYMYMSPEVLLRWRDMLLTPTYAKNLIALVVDEAHCVKKWLVDNTLLFSYC